MTTATIRNRDNVLLQDNEQLHRKGKQQAIEIRILTLKVEKLQWQLRDRKSERLASGGDNQRLLFHEQEKPTGIPAPTHADVVRKPSAPKGPKPFDPSFPRELIEGTELAA